MNNNIKKLLVLTAAGLLLVACSNSKSANQSEQQSSGGGGQSQGGGGSEESGEIGNALQLTKITNAGKEVTGDYQLTADITYDSFYGDEYASTIFYSSFKTYTKN